IERATNIIERVGQANKDLLRRDDLHSDYINAMAKEYIARQLVWRSITSKRAKWQTESEARYVVMNQAKNFQGLVQTHNGRHYITYGLAIDGKLTEINVGTNGAKGQKKRIYPLLAGLGFPGNPVTRSTK